MGLGRLERPTSPLSGVRSNHLSYRPESLHAKDPRPDAEKVAELFVWALARQPTEAQMDVALANIERNAKNRQLAYENIISALINTKEFIMVQ